MDITEWAISVALIALVLRQIRGRVLTVSGLVWPLALVAVGAATYLRQIPDRASDWSFVAAFFATGLLLGTECALLTRLHRSENRPVVAKATGWAATLWVVGMSGRLAFGLYATHGGGPRIADWSAALHLHATSTWAIALISMSMAEVASRSGVLGIRWSRLGAAPSPGGRSTALQKSPNSSTE